MENKEERVKIDLGFAILVAEKGQDSDYPEIYIGLEDKNGVWMQDLAIVGQNYHYNNDEIVKEKGMKVLVYADENEEDYTHRFDIGVYEEESEEV